MKRRGFLKLSSLAAGGALLRNQSAAAGIENFGSSSRAVALDVRTTGLDPRQGHRIFEIAAVEIMNHALTGRSFHS